VATRMTDIEITGEWTGLGTDIEKSRRALER
jgi:hypothetical protein